MNAETTFRNSLRAVSLMQVAMQVMEIKSPEELNQVMKWIAVEAV